MIMSVNVKITKSENFEINFENKIENNKSEKLREWQYIAWIMCRLSDNLVTNF